MSEKKVDPIHKSDVVLVEVSQDVYLAMSDNPSLEVSAAGLGILARYQDELTAIGQRSIAAVNLGAQVANAAMHCQGLGRLTPETIQALKSGGSLLEINGEAAGTIMKNGKFFKSVKFVSASGAKATALGAAATNALTMAAMPGAAQQHRRCCE